MFILVRVFFIRVAHTLIVRVIPVRGTLCRWGANGRHPRRMSPCPPTRLTEGLPETLVVRKGLPSAAHDSTHEQGWGLQVGEDLQRNFRRQRLEKRVRR